MAGPWLLAYIWQTNIYQLQIKTRAGQEFVSSSNLLILFLLSDHYLDILDLYPPPPPPHPPHRDDAGEAH